LTLGLDTFAVAAALGIGGLPPRARPRVSLLMSSFEMAMPVVGLLIGHALGAIVGGAADYVAIAVLGLLGIWMLRSEEDTEGERVSVLVGGRGLALLALGLSISHRRRRVTIKFLHPTPFTFCASAISTRPVELERVVREARAVHRFNRAADRLAARAGRYTIGAASRIAVLRLGADRRGEDLARERLPGLAGDGDAIR
jgi:Putative manganese efflux pump